MACWCAGRTTQEAVDTLGKAMIPTGPMLSPQQALDPSAYPRRKEMDRAIQEEAMQHPQ
jgi:hypothetical protein